MRNKKGEKRKPKKPVIKIPELLLIRDTRIKKMHFLLWYMVGSVTYKED